MFMLKNHLQITSQLVVFRNFCDKATKKASETRSKTIFKTWGQPTHETHPYLIKQDEVTPMIKLSEYQARRETLVKLICDFMAKTNANIKRHLLVVPSASKQYMSDKIPYFFRQNTDFLYLTGCQEPDSCLVISITESKTNVTLFMREKDDHSELWDGPRTGPENATALFGVDNSLKVNELEHYLSSYLKSNQNSSLWYDYTTAVQIPIHKIMCDYLNATKNKHWESPKSFLHQQRLIKSPAEIALMQKSCDVASAAIAETIKFSRPGINEHEIFAKVDYECRMNGAQFLAYPPVVAGGERANIIHYINNNQIVNEDEMVLMDAGCEYHGYSSDITRTWPVGGKFTPQQKMLYEVVLDVQLKLIDLCKNMPTLDSLFDSMCTLLGKQLQEIGIIPKATTQQMLRKIAYQFCPHHVSHYLGMDVHDTPTITRNINVKPGMIVTVEPGIYLSHKHTNVPREFRGMGIRIEDDVLITENGPLVLSRNCPKTVEEIETLANQNQ